MIKQLAILIFLFFILNLIWEFTHEKLYDWNKPPLKNTKDFKNKRLTKSILGDVFYLALIFILIALINHNFKFLSAATIKEYFLIALLGIFIAIPIEIQGLTAKWNYNSLMPTVFGIGLTPLIQLAVTGSLSLLILNKLS